MRACERIIPYSSESHESAECIDDEENTNYWGNDIKKKENIESAEECREVCQQYESCVGWSWHPADYSTWHRRKDCYIKDKIKNKKSDSKVISGMRECKVATTHSSESSQLISTKPSSAQDSADRSTSSDSTSMTTVSNKNTLAQSETTEIDSVQTLSSHTVISQATSTQKTSTSTITSTTTDANQEASTPVTNTKRPATQSVLCKKIFIQSDSDLSRFTSLSATSQTGCGVLANMKGKLAFIWQKEGNSCLVADSATGKVKLVRVKCMGHSILMKQNWLLNI